MKLFAVICNKNISNLNEAIAKFNAPFSCLYNEPIQEDLLRNAPFLIEVSEEIKPWLAEQKTPWGLYLLTDKEVTFNELRQHLRRYTYVKIPSEKEPSLFRFYDPRVFWDFTEIIDDWNLHLLLGPIRVVASIYGELKQGHFEDRRKSYPQNAKMKGVFLTLNEAQEQALNRLSQERFESSLHQYMLERMDKFDYLSQEETFQIEAENIYQEFVLGKKTNEALNEESDLRVAEIEQNFDLQVLDLAKSINNFCIVNEIYDEQYIKGIAHLFIRDKILNFSNMRNEWYQGLKKNNNDGNYRARMLLLKEFKTLSNI